MTKELIEHADRIDRATDREAAQQLFIESSTKPPFASLARRFNTSRQTMSLWAQQGDWSRQREEYWKLASARIMEKLVEDRVKRQNTIFDAVLGKLETVMNQAIIRLQNLLATAIEDPTPAAQYEAIITANVNTIKTLMETMKATIKKPLDVQEMVNAVLGKANEED